MENPEIIDDYTQTIKLQNPFNENGRLSSVSKIGQFFIAIGIASILMVIASLLSALITKSAYGMSSSEILEGIAIFIEDFKGRLNPLRFAQMVNTILLFGGGAMIMSYLITGKVCGFFSWKSDAHPATALLIPFTMVFAIPVVAFIASQITPLVPESIKGLEEKMMLFQTGMMGDPSWSAFIVNFLMIAILPGVLEELFFRGVLQKLLIQAFNARHIDRISPHLGIVVTGFIFGLIHGSMTNLIPISLLGILLGYLYFWTKNIWYPIIAHVFFNGIQFVSFFMITRRPDLSEIQEMEALPILPTVLSLIVFAGLVYLLQSLNRHLHSTPSF